MLKDLELHADGISKKAIYQGAKIAAEAITAELGKHKRTGDLIDSLGIPEMDTDKNGDWNTKIGFDGYDRNGVPNVIKARALESGTSEQPATPFVRPAMQRANKEIKKTMSDIIDDEIKNIAEKKGS